MRVAWMLGKMRASRAVEPLLDILVRRGDGDPYLLGTAAWSLGQIGDAQARPILEALANDPSASFMARREAEKALSLLSRADDTHL
jgi:HEAT repeat protein